MRKYIAMTGEIPFTPWTLVPARLENLTFGRSPITAVTDLLDRMKINRIDSRIDSLQSSNPNIIQITGQTGLDKQNHGVMSIFVDSTEGKTKLRYKVIKGDRANKFHPVWGILVTHHRQTGDNPPNNFDISSMSKSAVRICLYEKDVRHTPCPDNAIGLAFNPPDKDNTHEAEGTVDILCLPSPKPRFK